jgi:hypothetical protein
MALLSSAAKGGLRFLGEKGLLGDTARKGESAYYSAVVEALNTMPQKKGTKDQILNLLTKQTGVKKDELDFLKLGEGKSGSDIVTTDELITEALEKLPTVTRSKYGIGGLKPREELESAYATKVRDQEVYDYNKLNDIVGNDRMEDMRIEAMDTPEGGTEWVLYDKGNEIGRYDEYSSASGQAQIIVSEWADRRIMRMSNEDIIEKLNPTYDELTNALPQSELFRPSDIEPMGMGDPTFQAYSQQGGYGPEYRENVLSMDFGVDPESGRQLRGMTTQGVDTTTHFPSDPNYIAHTRGSQVNVLGEGGTQPAYLLDEIQSDLHQTARKNQARGMRGYQYGPMTQEQKERAAAKLDELSELKIQGAEQTKQFLDETRDRVWDTIDQFAATNPDIGDKVFVPMTDRGANGPESMFVVVGKDADGKPYFDHGLVDRSKDTFKQVEDSLNKRMEERELYDLDVLQTGLRPVTFMNSTSASPQLRGLTSAGNRIHRSNDPAMEPDARFYQTGNDGWLKQDYLNGTFSDLREGDAGFRFDMTINQKEYNQALEGVTREDFGLDPLPELKELRESMGDEFVDSEYQLTKGISPSELDRTVQQYSVNKQVGDLSGPDAVEEFQMFRDNLDYVPDGILMELQSRAKAERGNTYFDNVPERPMPNYPFENTYSGLGVKEGILEAIQQGADYMVLPDPVDQAARYDMLESIGGQGLQRHYENLRTNKVFKQLGLKPEPQQVQLFDRKGNYIDKELNAVRLTPEFKAKVEAEGLPLFTRPEALLGTGMVATQYPAMVGDEVGQEFADARSYLMDRDPNYNYGEIAPLARNKDTGLYRFAIPDFARDMGLSLLDLAESSRTGVARPDAAVGLLF